MAVRPILFNTPMVRAIRENLKTATRRIVSLEKVQAVLTSPCRLENPDIPDSRFVEILCDLRYGKGDVLWVRENWAITADLPGVADGGTVYMADYAPEELAELRRKHFRWRPSIHMPRKAAREFLMVTEVRAERLHSMTERDYIKEGIRLKPNESECSCAWETPGCRQQPCGNRDAFDEGKYMWKFAELWDSTVREDKYPICSYSANPWVCVIEFERCEPPKEG